MAYRTENDRRPDNVRDCLFASRLLNLVSITPFG